MVQIVRDVIKEVTPSILEAAHEVAQDASKAEYLRKSKELEKIDETRRKRGLVSLDGEGNKQQYDHENEVLTILEKVELKLSQNEPEDAMAYIGEGKTLVSKRLKMIRVADKSNWFAANEYNLGSIGSDDEDEKAIKKAINRASERSKKLVTRTKSAAEITSSAKTSDPATSGKKSAHLGTYCFRCGLDGHTKPQCYRKLDK